MSRNSTHPANWLLILAACFVFSSIHSSRLSGQGSQLDNVSASFKQIYATTAVYDSTRDLIYAAISPESWTQYKSRVVTIDPDTLEIIDSKYYGPEPTVLRLSPNDRRLFIGFKASGQLRWVDLATGELGAMEDLKSINGEPTYATDIALTPESAHKYVVCKRPFGIPYSSRGDLEVNSLNGKFSETGDPFGPQQIFFTGPDALIGFKGDTSPAYLIRYSYNGTSLLETKRVERVFFDGDEFKYAAGRIYTNAGYVLDAADLSVLGQFEETFSVGARIEPSEMDETSFVMEDGVLYLLDNTTLELLDTARLDTTLSFHWTNVLTSAGTNRLLFVNDNGDLGLIRGVPLTPKQPVELVLGPSQVIDSISFNATEERLYFQGMIWDVSNYSKITIFGGDQQDTLYCGGIIGAGETAFINNGYFELTGGPIELRVNGIETCNYTGWDSDDFAAVFDTPGDDEILSQAGDLRLNSSTFNAAVALVGQVYFLGGRGNDRATLQGSIGNERLSASLKTGDLRLSGDGFNVTLSHVPFVNVNVMSGADDRCSLIDSDQPDFFTAQGNYFRFTGNGYDFRGRNFDLVTANSDNAGRDRAKLKRNPGDTLFQSGPNNMLIGPGYKNNARGFEVLRIE
jgi:hypothetical protein